MSGTDCRPADGRELLSAPHAWTHGGGRARYGDAHVERLRRQVLARQFGVERAGVGRVCVRCGAPAAHDLYVDGATPAVPKCCAMVPRVWLGLGPARV